MPSAAQPAYAGNGDPLAAQRHRLPRAVEVQDRHLHPAARLALQARGDLLGREAPGVPAVDFENPVADPESRAVRRSALVGLGDDHPVALLADERPHAAVFARGEQLEIGHALLGNILRVGVQVADHARRGPLHQTVGVDRIHVPERQLAHHIDRDLHVAAQPEVVVRRMDRRARHGGQPGREGQDAVFSTLCHIAPCVCANRGGR